MNRRLTLGISALALGAGVLAVSLSWISPLRAAPTVPAPSTMPSGGSSAARSLATLRQRHLVDTARNSFDDSLARYGAGSATIEEVATWSRRTYQDDPERLSATATTAYVDRAARIEKEVTKRVASGNASKADSLAAAYFRAEAEAAEAEAAAAAIDQTTREGAAPIDPNGYR